MRGSLSEGGAVVACLIYLCQFLTKVSVFFVPAEFGLSVNPGWGLHLEDNFGVRVGL